MRKFLLIALLLSGMITSAQTSITDGNCKAAFKYAVNDKVMSILPATAIDFFDRSEGNVTFWFWDFGDGNTSTEQNPSFTFNHPLAGPTVKFSPYRTVTLTVLTSDSCKSLYSEVINIMDGTTYVQDPVECETTFGYSVNYDVKTFAPALVLDFYSKAWPEPTGWHWDFGDGNTSNEANPTHIFNLPTVKGNILGDPNSFRKVCLTVKTSTGCEAIWCETIDIYVSDVKPDTTFVTKPVNTYTMRYESSFPIYMSSCAGWAKAQVYMNDSLVKADKYVWSTGAKGQEVKGLCPTQMYTVKAITPDGTYVSGTFVFNSDGTVTEAPYNWWLTGSRDNQYILFDMDNRDLTVEWRLCDGTIVKSDSIPLNLINCGTSESNMILKDVSGNVVHSEIISLKTMATGIKPDHAAAMVKLYPNPVKDVLIIHYSGSRLNEMQLEICDIAGRIISAQNFFNVESGQQISLNVNSLRKGIYICKIYSGKQIIRIEKFSK